MFMKQKNEEFNLRFLFHTFLSIDQNINLFKIDILNNHNFHKLNVNIILFFIQTIFLGSN